MLGRIFEEFKDVVECMIKGELLLAMHCVVYIMIFLVGAAFVAQEHFALARQIRKK